MKEPAEAMELHAAAKHVERTMGFFVHVVKPGASLWLSVCLMYVSPKFVYLPAVCSGLRSVFEIGNEWWLHH